MKRRGRDRWRRTLMDSPIRVAMLQRGIVGVKVTRTRGRVGHQAGPPSATGGSSVTWMSPRRTTPRASRLCGCSGSRMSLMCSAGNAHETGGWRKSNHHPRTSPTPTTALRPLVQCRCRLLRSPRDISDKASFALPGIKPTDQSLVVNGFGLEHIYHGEL